jgi:transposase
MKVKTKEVREVVGLLDEIIREYKKEKSEKKRDWRTYEQQLANRIKTAIRELEPLIDKAISTIVSVKFETRGRKTKLSLKQKLELLLIKHLVEKSNREMSNLLVIFSLLSNIDVSYKMVERLYSDEEVLIALLNMHSLILQKRGITKPNCSGDGTGYSLTIKQHYASVAHKLKDKKNDGTKKIGRFIFSFRLLDLDTRMYIAFGTGLKSEQEAFLKAMKMVELTGMESIRLDRYYSCQKYVKLLQSLFGKDIEIFLIPKKNATIKGPKKWKDMLESFVDDTIAFLGEYFQRCQSESCFSEDKRRFGWTIPQRRPDRIETNNICTGIWHNLLWLGGN